MKFRLPIAAVAIAGALALFLSSHLRAQTQMQFPTTPWGGYAPAVEQCGTLKGANFNVTTDQAIPISVPTLHYQIYQIVVDAPSVSLTTAAGGFYPAASKGGDAIVAATQAYTTLTNNTANTTGNMLVLTLASDTLATSYGGPQATTPQATIYFSLTTAQGAAATANIRVYCVPLFG